MSTTVTMWLGIAFVALAIAATILQAWLWSFPMVPDPGGPDPNGRSTAPRSWTHIHRAMGLAYAVIYVVLMIEMVPRLWSYQVELPARTIMHATMGITIGVLLVAKVSIIRWFQHFGKALPTIGLGLLLCTLILATLSIPYAVKAHAFDFEDVDRERLTRLLSEVEFEQDVDPAALSSEDALMRGRQVLTTKCVVCHDLRTILKKPRTPESWHSVVDRMLAKPTISQAIEREEVPLVTAYLVAITPDLQESKKIERKRRMKVEEKQASAMAVAKAAEPAPKQPGDGEKAPEPPKFDEAKAKSLYEDQCSQCHELTDVDGVAPKSQEGWLEVIERMISENDAEMSKEQVAMVAWYLTKTKGKK